jgi:trehalose synthase
MALQLPHVDVLPLARWEALIGAARMRAVTARVAELSRRLAGRVVWNVSSTAVGGGVAEMVRTLLAYARGAGVDARWVVIEGSLPFFRLTKRLHNAIHGGAADEGPFGDGDRRLFEAVARSNAEELAPMVRAGDVVIVHDPQPAGLVPILARRGAHVIWRCHIGPDRVDVGVAAAWSFLAPYLAPASAYVFSRASYVPAQLDGGRAAVIPPSIDPFSPKNQPLDERAQRSILACAGLIEGDRAAAGCEPHFLRVDGTPGRVDRRADLLAEAGPPNGATPLVVQVSRWDRLKDPLGVLEGFLRTDEAAGGGAHLVLAGADVRGVADDPEGAAALAEVAAAWRALREADRRRVHLASLPTADVDENAAIVNALQRHAAIVIQKSLREGFGLTVTEAMWKGRPVIASAVGGLRDQIEDGVDGLLLPDPRDLDALAADVTRLLRDPALARRLGDQARAHIFERHLGLDSLLRYGALIEELDGGEASSTRIPPAP